MIASICIPSYNRPHTLKRLLDSIDISCKNDIEIIICEDLSPKRDEIREVVNKYITSSELTIHYYENIQNMGYDGNLKELVFYAKGDFIIFMGDDDFFEINNFKAYIDFLKNNSNCGYVLKTWSNLHDTGWKEPFKYFNKTTYFEKGINTYVNFFRLSTFISGFTIKTTLVKDLKTNLFDGTLLYQLYLLAEVTLNYPSVFCDIPLTLQTVIKADIPHFGSSESEKKLYTPGVITIDNSITFLKNYFIISKFIDTKYKINSTDLIKKDMTKYSYSYLVLHRDKGVFKFFELYKRLISEVGLNKSFYIHFYFITLLIFNIRICNQSIYFLKKVINRSSL
jgi:abequosyltransferase